MGKVIPLYPDRMRQAVESEWEEEEEEAEDEIDWLEIESAKLELFANFTTFLSRIVWAGVIFYAIGVVL
jgi:hypothetical protein